MKFTDQCLKLPMKTYTAKDWKNIKKLEKLEEDTDTDLSDQYEEPPYAIGTLYLFPEDIISIEPSFSFPREISDVIEHGFDLSIITVKNGKDYSVNMSPEELEERINSFIEEQTIKKQQYEKEQYEKRVEEIKKTLQEKLPEVVEQYKNNGIDLRIKDIEDDLID